jgi:hypothetical protein
LDRHQNKKYKKEKEDTPQTKFERVKPLFKVGNIWN